MYMPRSFVPSVRHLVTIDEKGMSIRLQGREKSIPCRRPKLFANDTIKIKGDRVSLGALSLALTDHDEDWLANYLDERGQIEVGQYLYKQLFGVTPAHKLTRNDLPVEIRIITHEDVARLPWVLLAHGGVFLAAMGWSVSLSGNDKFVDVELPPLPRILVAAPQSSRMPATGAREHIRDFLYLLGTAGPAYSDASRFRVVFDFSSLVRELKKFQPDILYYYGHGIGNQHTTHLVFADRNGRRTEEKPVSDLVVHLHALPVNKRPVLAYINCCQGDSGGLLGVGKQLLGLIPAVITNRTTAYINAAGPQAIAFWKFLLLKGWEPHAALTATRSNLAGLGLTTADMRWMTPVQHCRYDNWRATPPTPPSRMTRDPNWRLKVDRVKQFSTIFYQTHQMIMERKPRGLAYLWYGTPEQGLEIFHERLGVELEEKLTDTVVYKRFPVWQPDDLSRDPHRSLTAMFCQAFDVDTFAQIPGRIRAFSRGISGKQVLVYLCHEPVRSRLIFDPRNIRLYLEWWNNTFIPSLPRNAHALLGISYHASKPSKFQQFLLKKQRLDDFVMSRAVFKLLDELERINRSDLIEFILTHNIMVPSDLRDKVLDDILARSNGEYHRILEELEDLESSIWREGVDRGEDTTDDEDDDDGL